MEKSILEIFGGSSELDKRSAQKLIKAIEDNNLDGFDYLEFKQSLTGLAQIHSDELTRYKSAYVTASTLGLTKDKLIETAQFYKKVIQKEKLTFDQAAQNQIQKGIGNKKQLLAQMETIIKQKQEQVAKLQQEIADHQQKAGSLREELSGAEQKIHAAKSSFHNACVMILGHIDEDIQKINTYIQE